MGKYQKKPVTIIISSLIIALVALVIIINNLRANKDLELDEGIQVHLDSASGFGITSEQAREIYDMQRAEDLRMQLLQSHYIDDAVVLVDTAEASPFRVLENKGEAKVTVILTIADNYTLSDIDVQAIENLIRGSVPNIKDENINIT